VGRPAEALAPTEEAVTLRREQAAANPAYLPDLAAALTNLGQHRLDAGLPWDAEAAWSSGLDEMPTSDLKVGLLLEKAQREDPRQATTDVLAAVALTPPPSTPTLFRLHSMCRELRGRNQDLFDSQWQERSGTPPPPWLFIEDITLTTVAEWLDTPTHLQARDYQLTQAGLLARPEARAALDEIALLVNDPDLIGQYRPLLDAATEHDIQQAYQPLILQESLFTWLGADISDQQRMLRESREMLLSGQAAALLDQWASDNPGDTAITFGKAMLTLAQEGFDSKVLTAAEDSGHLSALLGDLLAADRPQLLLAATQLLLCLNLDDHTEANAEFHQAVALALTGRTEEATRDVHAATRLDPNSQNRWISILAQLIPAHPELASLIQALVTAPPDQPDDAGGPSRQAGRAP
jgi:tetratricopeptide (TPR) repeat protein